jgi:hypothetical protein
VKQVEHLAVFLLQSPVKKMRYIMSTHELTTQITTLSAGAVHAMKNPAGVYSAPQLLAFMKNAVFMKTAVVCEIQQRLQQNSTICYEC